MSQESDQSPTGTPPILGWEIFASLPALVLTCVLVFQRHLVYDRGKWGVFNDNILSLAVWAVLAIAILLGTKPWVKKTRYGSLLRGVSLLWAGGCLLGLWLVTTGWGRYQIVRFETLHGGLGISRLGEKPRVELDEEIFASQSGVWILDDEALLRSLARTSGPHLLVWPRAARVILASLLRQGVRLEELWQDPETHQFLLACLLGEADPQPWHRLEWVERPALKPDASSGLMTGLLSAEQARQIVQEYTASLEQNNRDVSQALVYCLMNFPSLFAPGQADLVMQSWASKFDDLEALAVEGLVSRDLLKDLIAGADHLRVWLDVKGVRKAGTPRDYLHFTVPEMVLGLIRSCGVEIELVSSEDEADLAVRVVVHEIAHHDYTVPTYDYETYSEQQTIRTGKYSSRTRQVRKQRQVLSGRETKTEFAPVVKVTLVKGEQSVELDETLLYWHHLRFDHETGRFLDSKDESVYGRMWPFGVKENLLKFGFLTDVY